MKCLVTGASGFIGSALIDKWLTEQSDYQITGLSRKPARLKRRFNGRIGTVSSLSELDADSEFEVVVNLAGEPILDRRWSEQRKQQLYDSRIGVTEQLLAALDRSGGLPRVMISGSAIGFYGSQWDDRCLNEREQGSPCFAHSLCRDWEHKALEAEPKGVRVCLLRTGVVIGNGGALARMLPPFRFGLGGPIGHGRQWMSWIDLEDMICAIDFLVRHETLAGPFNLTAPTPVTNREFSQALGKQLRRPAVITMPATAMRLLLGEGAELLVEGQRVVPERLLQAGFNFRYPQLSDSLQHWLAG